MEFRAMPRPASPSATRTRPKARSVLGARSGLAEEDLAEECFGVRVGVLGVDGDGDRADGLPRLLSVDPPVVRQDVACLRQPLPQIGVAAAHDDVGDRADLLAREDRADGRVAVPDVADDPRPYR